MAPQAAQHLLLAVLLPAAGSAHWVSELQELRLEQADPCVRLLSTAGPVGCSTPPDGALAPLRAVLSHEDLAHLLAAAPSMVSRGQVVSVALSADLLELDVLRSLRRRLGASLHGIAVLHSDQMPHGAASPEPARVSPLGRAWNQAGSGLSRESFDFGIVLLNASETAATLAALGRTGAPPLLQLKYPMLAVGDSPTCLVAGTCLPLGGQSVWGALEPRRQQTVPPLPTKPVVLLTAALDGTAFFHGHAAGADAAVSSTVALLAAVEALTSLTVKLGQRDPAGAAREGRRDAELGAAAVLSDLPRTPAFAFFTGEAWGQIGSRRFFYDIDTFNCTEVSPSPQGAPAGGAAEDGAGAPALPSLASCIAPFKPDLRFESLRGAGVTSLLEIGPVGAVEAASAGRSGVLFLHEPPGGEAGGRAECAHGSLRHGADGGVHISVRQAVHEAAGAMAGAVEVRAATVAGLPPGAAASLLAAAADRDSDPASVPNSDRDSHTGLDLNSDRESVPPASASTAPGAPLPSEAAAAWATPRKDPKHKATAQQEDCTAAGRPDVAVLSDFDSAFAIGGRYGSRFDTGGGLDAELVCRAAGVAARAWWRLAGGSPDVQPEPACALVTELLECFLASEGSGLRSAGGGGPAITGGAAGELNAAAGTGSGGRAGGVGRNDTGGGTGGKGTAGSGSPSPPDSRCRLLRALDPDTGGEGDRLRLGQRSRYTGVHFPLRGEDGASDTARFTAAVLRDILQPTCGGRATWHLNPPLAVSAAGGVAASDWSMAGSHTVPSQTGSPGGRTGQSTDQPADASVAAPACEPSVLTHDALSPLVEFDASVGAWVVAAAAGMTDGIDPVWAESNWPPGVHATVWPFPPSHGEPVVLFLFSAVASLVALVAVAADSVMRGWRTELHRMSE